MPCDAPAELDSAPPVAIIAFDGMQSHRWAAPPTMSRSISVTSAPRRAACGGRVLPAGPAADDHEPHGHRAQAIAGAPA